MDKLGGLNNVKCQDSLHHSALPFLSNFPHELKKDSEEVLFLLMYQILRARKTSLEVPQ